MTFAEHYGPWALIAGASEGTGASFARQIAEKGLDLVLVDRAAAKLESLADAIREERGVEVRTLAADLTAADTPQRIAETVGDREVGLLVYNAGSRVHYSRLIDEPLEVSVAQIDLSCRATVTLCHQFGAGMSARRRGGIILLGSLSALAGSAGMAIYSAAKAFTSTLAEGLWLELRDDNVHVLGLMLGLTDTPAVETLHADGMEKMDSDDVVREGLTNLASGPIWIAGEANRATADQIWPMPRDVLTEAMSRSAAALQGLRGPWDH